MYSSLLATSLTIDRSKFYLKRSTEACIVCGTCPTSSAVRQSEYSCVYAAVFTQEPTRLTLAKGACAAVIDNGALSSLLLLPAAAATGITAAKPDAERALLKTCSEALRVLKVGGVLLISSSSSSTASGDSTHVCTQLARVFGVPSSAAHYKQSAANGHTGKWQSMCNDLILLRLSVIC
jgi:hypothetical protein